MLNGKRRKMIQRTIKLHTGVEKTLNSTKIITKTEWQKSAEKLYGSDAKQWRFKCPICGHTASVQEIMSAEQKIPIVHTWSVSVDIRKILVAILLRMDFWEFLMVVM